MDLTRVPQRALGRTHLRVSSIGLGTVKLGRDRGLKYPTPAVIPDDRAALALLQRAHELGINLIDTAPAYGQAEQRLGTLLYSIAPRAEWVLCTKAGETFDPDTEASVYDFRPGAIGLSVTQSLKRLRTDRLDIVLLHFASRDNTDEQVLRAGEAIGMLRRMQQQGMITTVGASVGTLAGARLALELCDVLMVTLNPSDLSMRPIIHEAAQRGLGVLIKKPLASGTTQSPADALKLALGTQGVSSAILGTTSLDNLTSSARIAGDLAS
jgi:aryl-alcohol dehydrogenase-like predicted oxidoreductase